MWVAFIQKIRKVTLCQLSYAMHNRNILFKTRSRKLLISLVNLAKVCQGYFEDLVFEPLTAISYGVGGGESVFQVSD